MKINFSDLQSLGSRPHFRNLRLKSLRQVLWIYLLAIILAAFSFHSEASEKNSKVKAAEIIKQKKVGTMFAKFETSLGNFTIKLAHDKAPKTVESFVGLAEGTKEWTDPKTGEKVKRPYFNGTKFHRVIKGFMIQGGDPLGNGTGGPGFVLPDEFHKDLNHSKAGMISMANRGPNTGGSQFFITVAPASYLDNKHAVFGEVTENYKVVEEISKVSTDGSDRPKTDVVIKSVTISKK